ncbi:MAG: undecaprenyldiphospho-muramoylpentapeptide beta-N-acetylglucosaminyltransferase [Thermostichales cyanobacterium BF4_bins_65]
MSKILVAASGTGGHIFPALAVAETLVAQGSQVEWLGVPDRLERSLLGDRFPLHLIEMEGIQERRWTAYGRSLAQLLQGTARVKRLLDTRGFQAVLTTGGYIAAPTILAARLSGIPVLLHESNAIPGKVTRWLGRWCRQVLLGFPQAAHYLPGVATRLVGTPVRREFGQGQALHLSLPGDRPLIVVMGGSQGARGLNRMVLQCAPAWLAAGAVIVHLTGATDAAAVQELAPRDPAYLCFAFREDVAALLQRASFVVSRAGAASLAELSILGIPALLIPYPYAAEDHQYYNALAFAQEHTAYLWREQADNQPALCEQGLAWIREPPPRQPGSRHQQAAAVIANLLLGF